MTSLQGLNPFIFHVILEWTSVTIGVLTLIIALKHLKVCLEPATLILCFGIFWTSAMDIVHIVASTENFLAVTWAISRFFNAAIIMLGAWLIARNKERSLQDFTTQSVLGIGALFGLLGFVTAGICALIPELPRVLYSDAFIKRPYDLPALAIYALIDLPLLYQLSKREQSTFSKALVVSMIPLIAGQVSMVFFSKAIYDNAFIFGHSMKILAYLIPFLGMIQQWNLYMIDAEKVARTRFQLLVDAIKDYAIFKLDYDGIVISWNSGAAKLLGFYPSEILGKYFSCIYLPEEMKSGKPERALVTAAIEGRFEHEGWQTRRDGVKFWANVVISRMEDERGKIVGFSVVIQDLTTRKRSEEEIRTFNMILENAVDGISRIDCESRYKSVNTAYARVLGYAPSEIMGLNWLSLFHPADQEKIAQAFQKMRTQGKVELEARGIRKDSKIAELSITLIPESSAQGAVWAHYCFIKDISEYKKLQQQLFQADRLSSIGMLAAGIAHEVNNPLAFVSTNIELSGEELHTLTAENLRKKASEIEKSLEDAKEGCERIRTIVSGLKTFSRSHEETVELVDVNKILDSTIHMASNEIKHRATLKRDYHEIPLVRGCENKLAQVFLNLLVNAAHAIPEGKAQENTITVFTSKEGTDDICVEVRDTGCGISPEILDKIFDPFFTTKPVGVGTGLGLSICHGIVTALGGEIRVESQLGKGSCFRVILPAGTRATASVVPIKKKELSIPASKRLKILIIDDEAVLAYGLGRALSKEHDISLAYGGTQALELIRREGPFDLILCDVMMPDLTGMEIYEKIRKERPELEKTFVFMTGGAFTPSAIEFLKSFKDRYVEKPIGIKEVRELVRKKINADNPSLAA